MHPNAACCWRLLKCNQACFFLGGGGVFNRFSFWQSCGGVSQWTDSNKPQRRANWKVDDVGSGDGWSSESVQLRHDWNQIFHTTCNDDLIPWLISKINTHPKMDAAPIHTCKHRDIYIPLVIVCICSQWFIPSALKSCFIQHWADFMLLYMMPAWRFTSCSSEMACLKNLQFPNFSRLQSNQHWWFTLQLITMVNHYQASFAVGFDRWLLGLWNQHCRSVHCFEPNSLATASLEFKWADPNLLGGNLTNSPDANNHRSSTTTNQNLCLKSQSSKLNYSLWNQKLHHYNTSLFIFLSNPWCKQKSVSNNSCDFRYPQAHRFISRATKSKSAARAELFSLSLVGFLLGFRDMFFWEIHFEYH